jgi:hypothetical protein
LKNSLTEIKLSGRKIVKSNMKQNIDDILKQNARHSGMTVPDGYFADFAAKMEQSLPEKVVVEAPVKRSRSVEIWMRVRPYVYMAAMFCGVWLMMWMFNDMSKHVAAQQEDNMASLVSSDVVYDYYTSHIDEYDLMEQMYADGVDPEVFADN